MLKLNIAAVESSLVKKVILELNCGLHFNDPTIVLYFLHHLKICNLCLLLKAYENGRQTELFAMEGTIPITIKGKQHNL